MLSAKKVSEALQREGVKVSGYQESQNPKIMDGEVTLENGLSVQVGADYACLCKVEGEEIDYLLEVEEVASADAFAEQVARFMKTQAG